MSSESIKTALVIPRPSEPTPTGVSPTGVSPTDVSPAEKIASAIEEDISCRYPGTTEGLYKFNFQSAKLTSPVGPARKYSLGMPTIVPKNHGSHFKMVESVGQFRQRLGAESPALASFDFKGHGLRLAGGSVASLALHANRHYSDYDVFLVGLTSDAEAQAAIRGLAEHLSTAWPNMVVYRTTNCITFADGNGARGALPVQVVLRQYATAAEVLHSFDMGSCAFLWDGEQIFTTAMGQVAADFGINVLQLHARRASYETRLIRYFSRGFGLALPQLDVEKLDSCGGQMTYIGASIHMHVRNNGEWVRQRLDSSPAIEDGILAYALYKTNRGASEALAGAPPSSYAPFAMPYKRPEALEGHNLNAVCAPKPAGVCAWARWTPDLDMFSIQPEIGAQCVAETIMHALHCNRLNLAKLQTIVGTAATMELTRQLAEKAVDLEYVGKLSAEASRRLTAAAAIPFELMPVVEDGTALVGPYGRRLVSAEDWYGPAFAGSNMSVPAPAAF